MPSPSMGEGGVGVKRGKLWAKLSPEGEEIGSEADDIAAGRETFR
jgi:hypothetical protein